MPKPISGRQTVRVLERYFGFMIVKQRGSHVKLRKATPAGMVTTVVPLHRELAHGTLRGILHLAKIEYEDFQKFM